MALRLRQLSIISVLALAVCSKNFGLQEHQLPIQSGASGAVPRQLPDIVASVNSSIVEVRADYSFQFQASDQEGHPVGSAKSARGFSVGTGFVIDGNSHIATADHIIDPSVLAFTLAQLLSAQHYILDAASVRIENLEISIEAENGEHENNPTTYDLAVGYQAEVFKQDRYRDIAVLSCKKNLLRLDKGPQAIRLPGRPYLFQSRTVPDFALTAPRAGEAVLISGFPVVAGPTASLPQYISGITTISGMVANPFFAANGDMSHRVYLIDAHVNHGDSGGPVFRNTDGRVIGFVDAYLNATEGGNSNLTVVVPINQVLTLLNTSDH